MTQKLIRPKHGMLHIYTGDGKGKTTSSFGLSIRSAGADNKILIVQFDKGPDDDSHYSERTILWQIENIELVPTGMDRFKDDGTFRFGNEPEDLAEAQRGLEVARNGIASKSYNLVVLDEIITAVSYNLLVKADLQEVIDIWKKSDRFCELVLTGRGAESWLIDQADLVTEMRKIKHYFDKGYIARKGIEF